MRYFKCSQPHTVKTQITTPVEYSITNNFSFYCWRRLSGAWHCIICNGILEIWLSFVYYDTAVQSCLFYTARFGRRRLSSWPSAGLAHLYDFRTTMSQSRIICIYNMCMYMYIYIIYMYVYTYVLPANLEKT